MLISSLIIRYEWQVENMPFFVLFERLMADDSTP